MSFKVGDKIIPLYNHDSDLQEETERAIIHLEEHGLKYLTVLETNHYGSIKVLEDGEFCGKKFWTWYKTKVKSHLPEFL